MFLRMEAIASIELKLQGFGYSAENLGIEGLGCEGNPVCGRLVMAFVSSLRVGIVGIDDHRFGVFEPSNLIFSLNCY